MRALFGEMEAFAASNLPVLIRGESGTGKELVAAAIQRLSGRRERGFQIINSADLTPELLRSELFGHERGAFTGAVGKKEGLLTRVDGGTVFLDEIGELLPPAQTMLLRFLQAGEGLAVGAARGTRVDVRVIAATHRDLEAAVELGSFREDFYYRLWGACWTCRRCGRGARTSRCWSSTFACDITATTSSRWTGSRRRRWRCLRRIPGRETCASWNGSYTGPWPCGVAAWCSRRT
jgi:sigma54-dependent transcription regulator